MSVNASQASMGDLLSYTVMFTNNSIQELTCMFASIDLDLDLEVEAGGVGVNNAAISNQSLELIPLPNLAGGNANLHCHRKYFTVY